MDPPEYSSQAIRTVTVRQLLNATQLHSSAPFCIDGKSFKLTALLGNAYEVTVEPTFVSFKLDDGTGRIRVQLWTERGPTTIGQLLNSPYVRVFGELHFFRGMNIVHAKNVLAAPNPYEIFEHILKAIQETLIYAKGPPPSKYTKTPEIDEEPPEEEMPDALIHAFRNSPLISPFEPTSELSGSVQRAVVLQSPGDDHTMTYIDTYVETSSPISDPVRSSQALCLPNPYLNLAHLEHQIIDSLKVLTGRSQPNSHEVWDGIPIANIFTHVLEQTPDTAEVAFQDALSTLIDRGLIYRPILHSHCVLNQ
ncbi:hypothetical protein B0H11DRAFT_2148308 [Mycena galericulata]|nr:hypothetical protein B0H11DRAFT_2148308 [Mycena galericulata]